MVYVLAWADHPAPAVEAFKEYGSQIRSEGWFHISVFPGLREANKAGWVGMEQKSQRIHMGAALLIHRCSEWTRSAVAGPALQDQAQWYGFFQRVAVPSMSSSWDLEVSFLQLGIVAWLCGWLQFLVHWFTDWVLMHLICARVPVCACKSSSLSCKSPCPSGKGNCSSSFQKTPENCQLKSLPA